jgi:hypothetical protein
MNEIPTELQEDFAHQMVVISWCQPVGFICRNCACWGHSRGMNCIVPAKPNTVNLA